MNKLIHIFLLSFLTFTVTGCDNDNDNQNMLWEVVSNSNPEMIEVVNQTTIKFDYPSNIWVKACCKEGYVVLKCTNHMINFTLIGPNGSYSNPDGSFSITEVDANMLCVHFDSDESGKVEYTDQITITNADSKDVVCNTFLFITRSFGELQPNE